MTTNVKRIKSSSLVPCALCLASIANINAALLKIIKHPPVYKKMKGAFRLVTECFVESFTLSLSVIVFKSLIAFLSRIEMTLLSNLPHERPREATLPQFTTPLFLETAMS